MDINLFPQIYMNIITYCLIYIFLEARFHVQFPHYMFCVCGSHEMRSDLWATGYGMGTNSLTLEHVC